MLNFPLKWHVSFGGFLFSAISFILEEGILLFDCLLQGFLMYAFVFALVTCLCWCSFVWSASLFSLSLYGSLCKRLCMQNHLLCFYSAFLCSIYYSLLIIKKDVGSNLVTYVRTFHVLTLINLWCSPKFFITKAI